MQNFKQKKFEYKENSDKIKATRQVDIKSKDIYKNSKTEIPNNNRKSIKKHI